MNKTDTEYLRSLQKNAIEMRIYLGNKAKAERERSVCRAFLRTIGVVFKETEIVAVKDEPPDTLFRSAQFEIRELIEPDRKRHEEWKEKEKKYSEANSLDELLEPYSPPTPVELLELVPEIVQSLSEKAMKYGAKCSDIDALVYVNLKNQYLEVDSDIPDLDELRSQGWRSVSLLFPPYGVILFAGPMAPDFLRTLAPSQYVKYEDICSLFDA